MTYIIHGATGAQGAPVIAALLKAGKSVTAVARNSKSVPEGTSFASVDYASVEQLASVYNGAEGVFIHLPLGGDEERLTYAKNIVAALAQAKPARVIISTSGSNPDQSPHSDLISGVKNAGLSYAVVAPQLFFENLLLPPVLQDSLLRYPLRSDFPVSWSSHLDVADAVVALFERSDVTGIVGVGHLPGLTGPELAAGFSNHYGRAIEYSAFSPEGFGEALIPILGEGAAAGVTALYNFLDTLPGAVISEERSAQTLIGLAPRTVETWLKEIGR
ncbi:NmrA family NAD(P)-binding protein [Lysinibacter sp. HNR]|uniref:SDR family oxidoreductase n=1 Tax=Lysinibacter sp. HNR TaxID=3031408 RepID=UPI002435105B|nr:NmrA family NAD(P)-binding protein [Lysinibacter sp. HNR]WGD38178.1 NAD(P)H-binding protein [Lysinibacter sp. HNR]